MVKYMAKSFTEEWIRAWTCIQRRTPSAILNGLTAESICDQTVRQYISINVSGKALRFRLSNERGDEALVIGAASVGIGAKIHPITFNGKCSVEIQAGTFVLSDSIDLSVQPFQKLEVRMFFPEATTMFDGFAVSPLQDMWTSAKGDFTERELMPIIEGPINRRILTGVDVLSLEKTKVVVALGDSITEGNASGTGWPSYLAERVNGSMAVVNSGIGGNRLLRGGFGESALARFDRDVLTVPGATHVIVLAGINDIGLPGASIDGDEWIPHSELPTLDEMALGYTQLVVRAHDFGMKVYIGTLTPFQGCAAPYSSPKKEELRRAVNRWIRSSGIPDAVIDFEASIRSPSDPEKMDSRYDIGDHLHPNNEGQRVMANSIDLSVFE